jgi:hypothetical protein
MEDSLEISQIQGQTPEEAKVFEKITKETSLQQILDEFDKIDNEAPKPKERKKGNSAPTLESLKKNRLLVIRSPKNQDAPLRTDRPLLSLDSMHSPKQLQANLREQKGLQTVRGYSDHLRNGVEPTQTLEQINYQKSYFSGYKQGETTDDTSPALSRSTFRVHSRNSSDGNDLQFMKNPKKPGSGHPSPKLIDFLPSPKLADFLPTPSKLPQISKNLPGYRMAQTPTSHSTAQFNVSALEKPQSQYYDFVLTKQPDMERNVYVSPVKIASPSLIHNFHKIDSPRLVPISNDYLFRVLTNKSSSNSAAGVDSPISAGTPERGESQFARVGSFSVFKKMVENELTNKVQFKG